MFQSVSLKDTRNVAYSYNGCPRSLYLVPGLPVRMTFSGLGVWGLLCTPVCVIWKKEIRHDGKKRNKGTLRRYGHYTIVRV